MKKIVFILVLSAIYFSSCKKNTSTDSTPPLITLIGSDHVYVDKGTTYTDAGATAYDEADGDITAQIILYNPVDPNTIGTYYVTYNVRDKAGNTAVEVKRKVDVMIF